MTDGSNVTRALKLVALGVGGLVLVAAAAGAFSLFTKPGRRLVLCKVREAQIKAIAPGQDVMTLLAIEPRELQNTHKGSRTDFLYWKMTNLT